MCIYFIHMIICEYSCKIKIELLLIVCPTDILDYNASGI